MDDDGTLTIVDRNKDLVIVSGFNVFPAEVEHILEEHPAVGEAVVIGVPDAAARRVGPGLRRAGGGRLAGVPRRRRRA